MAYAIVKLKKLTQTTCSSRMHPRAVLGIAFIARKTPGPKWTCYGPGFGIRGCFGDGPIVTDEVEMLTPMLSFHPSEEMRRSYENR